MATNGTDLDRMAFELEALAREATDLAHRHRGTAVGEVANGWSFDPHVAADGLATALALRARLTRLRSFLERNQTFNRRCEVG